MRPLTHKSGRPAGLFACSIATKRYYVVCDGHPASDRRTLDCACQISFGKTTTRLRPCHAFTPIESTPMRPSIEWRYDGGRWMAASIAEDDNRWIMTLSFPACQSTNYSVNTHHNTTIHIINRKERCTSCTSWARTGSACTRCGRRRPRGR